MRLANEHRAFSGQYLVHQEGECKKKVYCVLILCYQPAAAIGGEGKRAEQIAGRDLARGPASRLRGRGLPCAFA